MNKLIIMFLLLCSFSINAAWKSSPYLEILKVYPDDTGLIFFTSYSDTSVSTCDEGKRFYLPLDGKNYSVKASVLLSAYISKKKILFRYNSQQSGCAAIVNRFLVKD